MRKPRFSEKFRRGQAMTEYAVVVAVVFCGVVVFLAGVDVGGEGQQMGLHVDGFLDHVRTFYINIFKFICLPFP